MPMKIAVDRFEGDWAVLALDDGRTFRVPRALLPGEANEGDHLSFAIAVDRAATEANAAEVRKLREDLRKTDPGGDLEL